MINNWQKPSLILAFLTACATPTSPERTSLPGSQERAEPQAETARMEAPGGAADGSASGLWSKCTAAELSGTVRVVRCDGVEVRIMRAPSLRGEPGVRAAMRVHDKEAAPAIQWMDLEGVRRVPFAVKTDGANSQYVAAPLDDALVVCVAPERSLVERCAPRVRSIAVTGLPPGVSFPPTRLEFMGVSLQVPEGCNLGTERITCPTANLDWRESTSTADPWVALEAVHRAAGVVVVSSRERRCTLGGFAGEGRLLEVTTPVGPSVLLICLAARGSVHGFAQCIAKTMPAPGGKYPAPCDQVFGVIAE